MSYEGYTQNLCESGHRFNLDAHWWFAKEPTCPHCGLRICWSNDVDQTNCYDEGYISEEDWQKFLHTPEVTEVCNLGHTHVIQQATYLVPSNEEAQKVRTVIVSWTGEDDRTPIRKYLKDPVVG